MDLTNVLIIALVCAAIGYVAGLMISNMRREPETKPVPAAAETPPPPDLSYLNVARFVRVTTTGPLVVEIDGNYYKAAEELSPGIHNRLEELTSELHGWLGDAQVPSRSAPQIEPFQEPPALEPEPVVSTAPQYLAVAAAEPVHKTGNTAPLSYGPTAQVLETKKRVPLSIVEQIDAILQENIEGTEFTDRGIRLIELPNQVVAVRVGLDQYPLDAVPDAGINLLIRAAVSEWELQAK